MCFFSLNFCLVRFWAFLGKGEFKNTTKICLQKVHVKNFLKKSSPISMSGFPRLVLFYRIFGCFSAMGVQKPLIFFCKDLVEKFLQKSRQKSKTDFFSICFDHVFGRFLAKGIKKKHDKKLTQKSDRPWYFFGLRGTNQPRQGPSVFF
jgi:hypothetical protein